MQTLLRDIGVYASKERVGKYKNMGLDANKPKRLKSSNVKNTTDTSDERQKLAQQSKEVRWDKYASTIEGNIEDRIRI